MRIAFCGAGSTGKTTMAMDLLKDPDLQPMQFQSLNVEARDLMDSIGRKNIDDFTPSELQFFQRQYIKRKIELEKGEDNFITQRSFVDCAAYWIRRDAINESKEIQMEIVNLCKKMAFSYDLHIFLPFGYIELEKDGYRSLDKTQFYIISDTIEDFLTEWKIKHLKICTGNREQRIQIAKKYILDNYKVGNDR